MVKIIDFIFPIAPLPKDKKERNAVIEGYERSLEISTSGNMKLLLMLLFFLFIGTLSVSHAYSTFNVGSLVCMLLPILLYFTSFILLICYKLKRKEISIHTKHKITVLGSFVFGISFIDILLGFLNYESWKKNKNIELDSKTYISILLISIIFYYVGYWYYVKKFNKMKLLLQSKKKSNIIGVAITGGLVSYFFVRNMTNDIFLLIFFPGVLLIVFLSACALVDYRQYDNIQRAKKGMTYK